MIKPAWIVEALKNVGVTEIRGPKHNTVIVGWLDSLRAWWKDDETPWCGVFVAHCMKTAGHPLPKYWMRAKDWLNWGTSLSRPVYGCVVVFDREGGGHVGFVVGRDQAGNLMVIGGNQGNQVNIRPFDRSRVVGYRWPAGAAAPEDKALDLVTSDGKLSTNEA